LHRAVQVNFLHLTRKSFPTIQFPAPDPKIALDWSLYSLANGAQFGVRQPCCRFSAHGRRSCLPLLSASENAFKISVILHKICAT
jgi:hypothetical protein